MACSVPQGRTLWLTILLCVVFGSSLAVAQGATGSAKAQWWEKADLQAKIGLTGEQVARIAEVENEHVPQYTAALKASRVEYRMTMTMITDATASPEELAAQRSKFAQAYADYVEATALRWDALRDTMDRQQWLALSAEQPGLFRLAGFTVRMGSRKLLIDGKAPAAGGK